MATQYVVRDTAGSVRNGTFPEGDPTTIYVSFSRDVSLNLGAEDIATYTRNGENLLVMLQNGEVLVLDGYFEENATGPKNLFLSEEGEIVEVFLGEANEGTIVPTYASLDVGGKWSAYDDMVFLDLDRIEPVVAPLAAPVFGGLGWLGAGGAALAATALVGGDDTDDGDNGGDDTGTTVTPTVDDPDSTQTIGGTQADAPVVTGTGVPGSTIQVTVNDKTVTTTVGGDGTWTATFDPGDLPSDGVWEAVVVGPDSNGTSITLDGPTMDIDTTPPVVNVTDGTQSTGDFVNAVTQASGTVITGTGEAGATLAVTVAGTTHTTTVDANGDWSVTFATSEISTGEYTTGISITSTDARGNATTVTDTLVVDTETVVAVDSGQAGGDDVINQAELAADVTLTGTAEAGASVQVTVQGVTRTATVDANGNWSAVFEAGSLPTGEYNTTITAVSTDAYGNSATSSAAIRVDTVAGDVALSPLPIEIDDIINAVERADGVDISGTATPGLTVTVGLGTATATVVADASGNWTTTFPAAQIPTGTSTLPITASITDAVGNSKTVTDSVQLDTEVTNFSHSAVPIEGDDIINAVERADGVTLNGTVEPGSTVMVQLGSATQAATVDAFGNWQVTYLPGSIPEGTYDAAITITATDAAGNVDTITDTVRVDTETGLAVNPNQTADDIINAAEHASGVTLAGSADAGSTVTVVLQGVTRQATADANGDWTVNFTAAELPEGTYTATATITATDPAGNSETVTETFSVDTEIADPSVTSATMTGSGLRRFGTDDTIDSYSVNALDPSGNVTTPAATVDQDPTFGTEFTFTTPIPDGTNLVVTRTDTAGNSASTLVVNEDNATTASTIGNSGIGQFDISSLNLEYNGDSSLVLTEAQIKALSDSSDTLTIRGKSDDTVTVTGAVDTGNTQVIDGETYNVYTIGSDGATLVIDEDVNVII